MRIVIEGAGEVGSYLAKVLTQEANEVTVIDNEKERLEKLSLNADVVPYKGAVSSINVLKDAGVGRCDLFIAVNPYVPQDVNIVSALLAKKLGAQKVCVRVDDEECLTPENRLIYKDLGIDLMFFPERLAAEEISDHLKHSVTSEYLKFAGGKLQVAVFKIREDSSMIDRQVGEFVASITKESLEFRVIAISREDKTIIPSSTTFFRYNDMVYTIAKRDVMPELINHFGANSISINKVMIIGGSEIAEQIAKLSAHLFNEIKIIEMNKNRCVELTEMLPSNVTIINSDGRNSDVLAEEDVKSYDAFVSLTHNDETNVLACVVAKKMGVEKVIAKVENIEYIRLAEEMGVDTVINKKLCTAGRVLKYTLSGKARMVKFINGTRAEVLEYIVAPGSLITKGPLKNIGFPKDAIIGGVIRGNEAMIAIGDTLIEGYDRVAVFALPEASKNVDRFFK